MNKKKYKKVTVRTLAHALTWGDYMCKLPSWTKSDANTYNLMKRELKRLRHEEYLRYKSIEKKPYLDSNQPYHTT